LTTSTASKAGIAVLLLTLWLPGGCARKPPPPPKQPTVAAPGPKEVVTAYLAALEGKDYRAAYEHLTSESRSMRSFDEFQTAAKQWGPIYDLERMEEEALGPDKAQVSVQLAEDPAVQAFLLKREDKRWRIVFKGGLPAAPTPE
jgi:hypothetical protein